MSGDHNMYSSPVVMPGAFYQVPEGMTVQQFDKQLREQQKTWEENTKVVYKAYAEGSEDQGDIMSRQVGGNHYKRACQPWEIIEEWELGYFRGNVLKYILRAPHKNGKEDLEKAQHYLEYLIANYDKLKERM